MTDASNAADQADELEALESIYADADGIATGVELTVRADRRGGHARVHTLLPPDFVVVDLDTGDRHALQHLPPLELTWTYTPRYPSTAPPDISLHATWLAEKQLSAVSAHLLALARGNGGGVAVFEWLSFLRDELLSFLGLKKSLSLGARPAATIAALESPGAAARAPASAALLVAGAQSAPAAGKDAAVPGTPSEPERAATRRRQMVRQLVRHLAEHNGARVAAAFGQRFHDCGICFDSKRGADCVKFELCDHIFCKDCVRGYLDTLIGDGQVQAIVCPRLCLRRRLLLL